MMFQTRVSQISLVYLHVLSILSLARGENPEVHMDVTQLITSKGYPCENHFVTTQDGYILNIQRLPHGVGERSTKGKKPVAFLQHGLMGSAADFVSNPPDESLAFLLADAGVDVWLGNSRGNTYSKNHTSLNPKNNAFWDFRWDEMAQYDVPAVINYVTSKTGSDQLTYLGISQGAAIGFARFSEDPVISKKVKLFIAMAPVARVGHITSPIRYIAPFAGDMEAFLDLFGHGAIDVSPKIMEFLAGEMCQRWGKPICMDALFVICGFDSQSFNMSRVDVYVAHSPSSTSARDIMQWAQGVNTNKFQHFDWGSPQKNMDKYGQPTPPQYYPGNVTIPVILAHGGKDKLSDPTDVQWLLDQLTTLKHHYYIEHYNHLDFALAQDAPEVIYKYLIPIIADDL